MSKIVVLAWSSQVWVRPINPDPFVEGLSDTLARMGNTVKSVILNDFDQKKVNKEVDLYKPDIIMCFNGAGISNEIMEKTSCPVVTDVCDSLFYFHNSDIVRKNPDRFYFITGAREFIGQIEKFFPCIPKNHIAYLGHVTGVRKKDIEQDIPVSFVGSLGNFDKSFEHYWCHTGIDFSDKEQIAALMKKKEAFQNQAESFFSNPLDISILDNPALPDFSRKTDGGNFARALVILRTCNLRCAVLEQLTDLGLKIYSVPTGTPDVIRYHFDVFKCFDYTPSTTLADAERTFSRSKISLNLPHGQIVNTFSWRVPDILASNACLLSQKTKELKDLMAGYIDMPMYESPAEARELAQKLLKDEAWRRDIVAASQQMIEDKCRFEHRLRKVADKLGLKFESPSEEGRVVTIRARNISLKNKIRLAIWTYLNNKEKLSFLGKKTYKKLSEKLINKEIIYSRNIKTRHRVKFVPFDRTFLDKSFVWLTTEPVKTLTASPFFTKEQQVKWFEGLKSQKDYVIQGVLYDEIPVGAWGLKHITTDSAEYFGYIGESRFWRKGIGNEMVKEAIKKVKKLKIKNLYLCVLKTNTAAMHLYNKNNFTLFKEKDGMIVMKFNP